MPPKVHLSESGISGRADWQRTPISWVHSFAMFVRDTTARNKFLWRKVEDSNPYRYRYPGVQTLFAPVRGTFLTLPFFTGGPVLLGRSFRVHPVILGAGRENRTPLSTAWKAEDAPCAYLHGRCGEIRTLNLPVKSGLL